MYLRLPTIQTYPHQTRILKAVMDGKHIVAIIHRRAGKDICCLQAWVLRALQRVGTHVYLFPMLTQARQVIWSGMDFDGKPFLSNIPQALIEYKNDARMEIRLINGSRLVLGGSNNINGLMGTNPVTIIYSEFALHHPMSRQYLNPILIQNGGMEIIQSTPRGKNHLYDLYETVRENPAYHIEHLSIDKTFKNDGTPIINAEQVIAARAMGMSQEMFDQEFMVSFDVGNIGAYFTREMAEMDQDGRITSLKVSPHLPLHTVWDLGGTDATACWLFQLEGKFIHLVHMLHDSGQGLKYYLDKAERIRASFGCQWGNHFMPHDVNQAHQGWEQAESRLMIARRHGWVFQVTPKVNFEDGIEAMRFIFDKLRIDKFNCTLGIRAIREYQREYDEVRACYKAKPLDNWATHIVDALRYLSVNWMRLYNIPQAPHHYDTSL